MAKAESVSRQAADAVQQLGREWKENSLPSEPDFFVNRSWFQGWVARVS